MSGTGHSLPSSLCHCSPGKRLHCPSSPTTPAAAALVPTASTQPKPPPLEQHNHHTPRSSSSILPRGQQGGSALHRVSSVSPRGTRPNTPTPQTGTTAAWQSWAAAARAQSHGHKVQPQRLTRLRHTEGQWRWREVLVRPRARRHRHRWQKALPGIDCRGNFCLGGGTTTGQLIKNVFVTTGLAQCNDHSPSIFHPRRLSILPSKPGYTLLESGIFLLQNRKGQL